MILMSMIVCISGGIRGCIFFGFQFFVKNEEKDGFLHEERIIVKEKLNQK